MRRLVLIFTNCKHLINYLTCTLLLGVLLLADDGLELEKLPKVKVLRNDKREGTQYDNVSTNIVKFPLSNFRTCAFQSEGS